MYIVIDGKSVKLTPQQLEKAGREHLRVELEEKASVLLEDYLKNSDSWERSLLSPISLAAPWHIDYLSDRIAARFRCTRCDTVTDAVTWRKAIRKELTARQKMLSRLPENSMYGSWLLRPIDALLQLLWRCQYHRDSVDFCLDESITGLPQLPYHAFFTESNGLLYIHIASPHSQFLHLLDDGTDRVFSYEDFAQSVKELLTEDLQHIGRKLPKYLWVSE